MPIYEYRCDSCGVELEKLQKISDPPLTECPECGKHTLVKLVSASSFRLKGSGWYETDFKNGNKKNTAGDSKPGKTDDSTGKTDTAENAGSKTESKADAKADKKDAGAAGSAGNKASAA